MFLHILCCNKQHGDVNLSDWLQSWQNRCHWRQQPPESWRPSPQLKNGHPCYPPFLCHSLCCHSHWYHITSDQQFSHRPPPTPHLDYQRSPPQPITLFCLARPDPRLTEVGACELGQDAEGAGLGGAGAGLPVLSVLDQPLLAAVVRDKTGQVLHPEPVPAHTPAAAAHGRRG